MTSALDRLDPRRRPLLRPGTQPDWSAPMPAVLTGERFSDPAWIFERKPDGERCLAFRRGYGVRRPHQLRAAPRRIQLRDRKRLLRDGRLRHSRHLGLRTDRRPREVLLEVAR